MNAAEWAILQNDINRIGCTVHIMDKGVDTGPILRTYPVSIEEKDTIESLHGRIQYMLCVAMVETAKDYLAGNIDPVPQKAEEGKQYFIMDSLLTKLTKERLTQMALPPRPGDINASNHLQH